MSLDNTDNLISAIREGSIERVSELISSSGLSSALPWSDGYPLLRVAISNKKTEIVKLLLNNINPEIDSKRLALTAEGREALSNTVNIVQFTILELTVINGDAEILEMLLEKCEENRELYVKLLLHVAVRNNKIEDVELLLKRGADVNFRYKGETPLHIAVWEGCVEIAKYLLNNGARVDSSCVIGTVCSTPLNVAIYKTNPTLVKLLLEYGASIYSLNKNHKNPLTMAFYKGHSIITAYIYVCSLEIKTRTRTKLLNAVDRAKNQYREIFQRFFRTYCFDSFISNKKSLLPILIHAAAQGGFSKIVEYFVTIGFEINSLTIYNPETKDRQTLLHSSVKNGQKSMAEFLIHNGSDVNAVDSLQKSPIFYAIEYVDIQMTKLLIGCGAKIRSSSYLLRSATTSGCREIVEMILEQDPDMDINARDTFGNTALHSASIGSLNENFDNKVGAEITKLLLNRGADVNARGYKDSRPLHFAVQGGRVEIVEMLLEHNADVNVAAARDSNVTPLHECARYANDAASVPIVKMLIAKNADVDAKTKKGTTALYHASERGNHEVAEILLKHGADVDAPSNDGTTPLHIAFNKGFAETIQVLLKFGADINYKCNNGKTPPEYIISRFINTELYCSRKCRCKRIIDIFKKQIIKMKIANLRVAEENLVLMRKGKYQAITFEENCRKEILRMRETKISGNASFCDILMKTVHEISIYAKYDNVVNALESTNWENDFPIYRGMILKNFKNGREREILLNPSVDSFNFLSGHEFLDVLTIEIFSYLGNEDLENLIKACRVNCDNERTSYVESTIKMLKNLFVEAKNFALKPNISFN